MRIIPIAFLLFSCAAKDDVKSDQALLQTVPHSTAPWLTKGALVHEGSMEATPVVFNNQLLIVTSTGLDHNLKLQVYDYYSKAVLAEFPSPLGFISAFVNNGRLYVFGNNGRGDTGNEFLMTSTSDLITWTNAVTLFTAPTGTYYFNNSVSHDANGGFIMAYEVCQNKKVCFHVRFARSNDLLHWTDTGLEMGGSYYTACPTIRYSNGYYYILYLGDWGQYWATRIARSRDLISWEYAPQTVVDADQGDRYNNASDVDFVEYNGQLVMIYANAPQVPMNVTTPVGIREVIYQGTFDQMTAEFFP